MNYRKITAILSLFLSIEIAAHADLIIENITLIDAEHPVRSNQTVLIENGKIESIINSNQLTDDQKEGHKVIDGSDKYLIPGLWDAHVHLTFTGAIMEKLQPSIDFVESNPVASPRLFYAGPLIDGRDRVYKGMEPGFPDLSIGIDETSDIENTVNDLIENGVTFLKSYEMLSKETYLELLQIARKNNLRVTGHIPLSIDLEEAIEAGLGGMQHVRNMDIACSLDAPELLTKRRKELENENAIAGSALRTKIHSSQRYYAIGNHDPERCLKIIKKLAEFGVFQTPTLTINTLDSRRFYADPEWQKTYQYLPTKARDDWQEGSDKLSGESASENDVIFDKWSLDLVKIMNEEGVRIIAGTDTPIGYLTPGYSLHKELELLFEAGMTQREVLRSATITPAEFLNIEDQIGTIDEGKLADLVILNSNPLDSISNTQDIYLVISKGKKL